ncbi:MAG: APC family permease [Planctomycetia bacterium]|nr:APC family permease [Planctomycetia bacterium]MCC7314650.1 APC family permease [Planctomycetota bacterium]OQZ06472.1 MAG: hypothetical protein B6D36_04855 [Planctomycetes bacterium UTPLA1]
MSQVGPATQTALRRLLGPVSVACVGIGGAIGSGIFATPGEAAKHLSSPWVILGVWLAAGVITLLQSMVTAELATRLPKAGGEYQFLKEAYGEFAAFFFGWSFTVFIVGGGAGTIAAAFGTFLAQLLMMEQTWAEPRLGCAAIIAVMIVNGLGLRSGAVTQNILTFLKTLALLAIAVGAMLMAGRVTPATPPADSGIVGHSSLNGFLLALIPAYWAYSGATDAAKLAEETRDVRRALPLALLTTVGTLTVVYCFYNYALLCAVTPGEMAGRTSVPSLIFARKTGWGADELILAASALICLGAISSVFLANVRVTYALARDGLTFKVLGRMSRNQAPIGSILVGGALACSFVLYRDFAGILRIYFLGSTVLFGLTYASLLVFRRRERMAGNAERPDVFYTPAGPFVAVLLIGIELALAVSIVVDDLQTGSRDSLWTIALLVGLALLYVVWRWAHGGGRIGQDPR